MNNFDDLSVSVRKDSEGLSAFAELYYSLRSPKLFAGLLLNLVGAVFVIAFSWWYRYHWWFHRQFPVIGSLLSVKVPYLYTGFFLVAWMLADLTVTNQLGSDYKRVLELLEKGYDLRSILFMRNRMILILSTIVAFSGTFYGVEHTHLTHHYAFLFLLSMAPTGIWLATGNIFSVLIVCKQLSLKVRLRNKAHLLRWLAASAIPYIMGFVIFPIGALPIVIANTINHLPLHRITLIGIIFLVFWSSWLWWLGYEIAGIIIEKRGKRIINILSDQA